MSESQEEWVEVKDPQSGKNFYANPVSGACSWEKPANALIKERDPQGEWWELFDEKNQLPYFYNIETAKTEWIKPSTGTVLSLAMIQNSDIGKRVSVHMEGDSKSAPPFPLPEGAAEPVEKEVVGEVKEASGTFEMQHAKLLPGWKQILDTALGRNYYINEETNEKTWDRSVATGMQEPSAQVKVESLSDTQRASTLQKAKKLGISGPILNKDAAATMSSLNPSNYDGDLKRIPSMLAKEINQFVFEDFSRKNFSIHKKGILRRKVPLEDQMCWTKEPLPGPLMPMNKQNAKEAVTCFKLLQKVMKDKGTLKGNLSSAYQTLLECGINQGAMRDELYVQVCKQLNKNPNTESSYLGLQLMAVYVTTFPPSKNFEQYLGSFFSSYPKETPQIETLVKYCTTKLERICKSGARGKVPSIPEIERAMEAPFNPSIFGETLEEVMRMQKEDEGDIPRILPFLTDAIMRLNGNTSEGIFRVPGDSEMVTELRLRLEKGHYTMEGITDPMVPASLLKFWLRELADPLIPMELYPEAIKNADDAKECVALIQKLDSLSKKVVYFILKFLQVIADPINQPFTKMTVNNLAMVFAPNFLRCPSENPQTIFENAKLEQNFVRNLILHLNTQGNEAAESSL